MTWLLTCTDREHHLSGPNLFKPSNVPPIDEIAHSLAQINRFTGHCIRPYSVAEHSLLVFDIAVSSGASAITCLAALMHDAHECVCGDVASPIKMVLGDDWHDFESEQQQAVLEGHEVWDAYVDAAHQIRHWDLIALATERRDLLGFDKRVNTPWPVIDTPGKVIDPWPDVYLYTHIRNAATWLDWEARFRAAYEQQRAIIAQAAVAGAAA